MAAVIEAEERISEVHIEGLVRTWQETKQKERPPLASFLTFMRGRFWYLLQRTHSLVIHRSSRPF